MTLLGAAGHASWLVAACVLALAMSAPIIAIDGDGPVPAAVAPGGPAPLATPGLCGRVMGQAELLDGSPHVASGAEQLGSRSDTIGPPAAGRATAAVAAAEAAARNTTLLAVAVLDRATGEVAVGMGGTEPFYTASLSKVVLVVDVLDRRRLDGLAVSDADLDLIRRALGPSDDGAMSALWSRFDGAGAAGRLSARLGLSGTGAPPDPSQWGEMSVSAADTVRIWEHLLDDMAGPDRDLLISAMQAAPAQAPDGFDQSYGLMSSTVNGSDGPGAVAKQGWMCCFSGQYYLNSAGAVGADERFLIALLTRQPRDEGWEPARQELSRIALAAVRALE